MLLPRNHWCPAFAPFHCLRLSSSGPSFVLPWPNQRGQRQFSSRTLTKTQERAFHSLGAQRNSSVLAHPTRTSSSQNEQPLVRGPFTILFCGRDLFSCAVFKQVYNAKGEFSKSKHVGDAYSLGPCAWRTRRGAVHWITRLESLVHHT